MILHHTTGKYAAYAFSSGLFFNALLSWAKEIPEKILDLASENRWTPLAAAQRKEI